MEDKIVLVIVLASCIVPLVILGIMFSKGKGAFLIAGYNTMSVEEQNKYDTVALCKFMGKVMYALSFSMLFWVLSVAIDVNWIFILGVILFVSITIFAIIYVNKGNKFKNT